ncbi:hypothetical protein BG011_002237 [Mortierella polycephala]|uniref:Oligopeptide transporter n=1 Tax=Mortierella polycephala TaxID=41804 RepID=A0A9P6Q5E9_9FUNG|nr:hypothetical protein BG011_002237 [Mortierella polycephala]
MVWPTSLTPVSLLRSLHSYKEKESEENGRMSRGNYYATVCLSSMAWYFLPGYFFPTVGVMSVICWLNPDNIILSQWTGSQGLGIGTIGLDWSYCAYYIQPLVTPWFAQVNVFIGFVATTYILLPLVYYNNIWGAKKYPILSTDFYRTNGTLYSVEDVIDDNNVLDNDLYNSYGPLRMSAFFAISYGVMFACVAATIVHTILYHGKEIVARFKTRSGDRGDIHTKLMRAYPEVPDLWYLILFVVCAVLSFITCVQYDYMPWWALILALVIAFVLVLPLGLVLAITNLQVEFNVVPQYIFGYLLPGHPIANATFKIFSHHVNSRALDFLAAQKIAHYMKIPPQIMFCTQLVASLIEQVSYGKDGAIYSAVLWGFVIGALLPMITWIIRRRFPNVSWLRLVHWPALLSATALMPPALPYMYINGHLLGFVFGFVLRRYQFRWWARYNYLTSAALDTGLAFSGLIVYIFFQSTGQDMVRWWGNPEHKDHCPMATATLE